MPCKLDNTSKLNCYKMILSGDHCRDRYVLKEKDLMNKSSGLIF